MGRSAREKGGSSLGPHVLFIMESAKECMMSPMPSSEQTRPFKQAAYQNVLVMLRNTLDSYSKVRM
eukprot:scaffold39787_cov21-Tisochrysis_lutea.AAC.1